MNAIRQRYARRFRLVGNGCAHARRVPRRVFRRPPQPPPPPDDIVLLFLPQLGILQAAAVVTRATPISFVVEFPTPTPTPKSIYPARPIFTSILRRRPLFTRPASRRIAEIGSSVYKWRSIKGHSYDIIIIKCILGIYYYYYYYQYTAATSSIRENIVLTTR